MQGVGACLLGSISALFAIKSRVAAVLVGTCWWHCCLFVCLFEGVCLFGWFVPPLLPDVSVVKQPAQHLQFSEMRFLHCSQL